MKALTEDSRQAYSGTMALSRPRGLDNNEQGDAIGEGMWHDVDFFRRVIRQRRKLGALTMTYVCTHCSTGHNVRERRRPKKKLSGWWSGGVTIAFVMMQIRDLGGGPEDLEVRKLRAASMIVTNLQD